MAQARREQAAKQETAAHSIGFRHERIDARRPALALTLRKVAPRRRV
jgi:hypothetical protein